MTGLAITMAGDARVMTDISILIANDPRAYRDTIAVALRLLRPHLDLQVADPETLDEMIILHAPQVAICSYLTTIVETRVPTWIVLYPDGALVALQCLNGARTTVSELDLNGIVNIIDETTQLAGAHVP